MVERTVRVRVLFNLFSGEGFFFATFVGCFYNVINRV